MRRNPAAQSQQDRNSVRGPVESGKICSVDTFALFIAGEVTPVSLDVQGQARLTAFVQRLKALVPSPMRPLALSLLSADLARARDP
jgi:hypothetical protein